MQNMFRYLFVLLLFPSDHTFFSNTLLQFASSLSLTHFALFFLFLSQELCLGMIHRISAERIERERDAGYKNIKSSTGLDPKESLRLYIATASSIDVIPVRTIS